LNAVIVDGINRNFSGFGSGILLRLNLAPFGKPERGEEEEEEEEEEKEEETKGRDRRKGN
jgi:hypothetical protein